MSGAGLSLWQTDGVPVGNPDRFQFDSDVTLARVGQVIITWTEKVTALSPVDIYAQSLNTQGVSQWLADGLIVSNAANNQIYPRIVSDENGGAIITWQDWRNGTDTDIYAQRVYNNGSLKAQSPLFFPIEGRSGEVTIIYLD